MTLIRKVYVGFTVMVLLLVALGVVAIMGIVSTNSSYAQALDTSVHRLETADDFRADSAFLSATYRGLLLFPASRQQYLERLDTGIQNLDIAARELVAISQNTRDAAKAEELSATAADVIELVGQIKDAVVAGDDKKAETLALDTVQPLVQLVDGAYTIADDAGAEVIAARSDLAQSTSRYVLALVILVLLAVVAAVVAAVLVSRSIRTSLLQVIDKLTTSSAELLAISTQVSSSAAETGASIVETTTTAREVKETVSVASEKAAEMKVATEETTRVAEEGTRSVDETIAGIDSMRDQMAVVTDAITRLSEQTAAVSDVITTVKDLAEQSNLLSVNASIEAAKAGDQGKGFAVVAQEVKNLADQSKQAVAQVREILTDIQKATTSAVLATELGSKSIERGAVQSRESGEAIQQLAESVAAVDVLFRQTAAAAEQQLAGVEQINSAMQAISEASSQNVTGSRQVEAEVQRMREVAQELRLLVEPSQSVAVPAT